MLAGKDWKDFYPRVHEVYRRVYILLCFVVVVVVVVVLGKPLIKLARISADS
jgi:hypothetical protein